jgi:hypothetical protein
VVVRPVEDHVTTFQHFLLWRADDQSSDVDAFVAMARSLNFESRTI